MTVQGRVKKQLLAMLQAELVNRAIGQQVAAPPAITEVRVYLPSNSRGDEFPPEKAAQWRFLQDAVADILSMSEPERSRAIEQIRRIVE